MYKEDFVIIGGDKRLGFTAASLVDRGYRVGCFANGAATGVKGVTSYASLGDAMSSSDKIVFGIPFARKGKLYAPLCTQDITVEDIASHIQPHHRITGGLMSELETGCALSGAVCIDYGTREDFCLFNAVPTAEAVIAILAEKLPVTLWGSKILVMGYGRIGKMLSQRLASLGAEVTVSARKSTDFALAAVNGLKTVTTSAHIDNGRQYDVIVNTIPQKILVEKSFAGLRQDCLITDVSAYPGYVSAAEAAAYGIEVVGAFSLPGKTAPATAGKIIADVVINIFDELKGV